MYERILVGTDGSETATRAVEAAASMTRVHGAALTVAYAFPPGQTPALRAAQREAPEEIKWRLSPGALAETTVQHAVEQARAIAGDELRIIGRSEPGHPVTVLLGLIDELDPDALVVGNRDMPGRLRLRRSVARALARRAACDVVAVDTLRLREARRGNAARPAVRLA